jgi:hypothetical protein
MDNLYHIKKPVMSFVPIFKVAAMPSLHPAMNLCLKDRSKESKFLKEST